LQLLASLGLCAVLKAYSEQTSTFTGHDRPVARCCSSGALNDFLGDRIGFLS
jgi:hypothetical protein